MIDRRASKSFRFADQSSRLGLKNLGVIEASSVLLVVTWLCTYVPPVAHGPDYGNAMPGPPRSGNRDSYLQAITRTQPLQRLMMEFLSANLDREIDLGKEGETMPQMSFEQLR